MLVSIHVLTSEHQSRRSRTGGIFSLDRCRARGQGRRRDVLEVGARKDGAGNRCKAGVEAAALDMDCWEWVGADRTVT